MLFYVAALAVALTSCTNDAEVEPGLATINLSITSDNDMTVHTRAPQNADKSVWYAQVGDESQIIVNRLVGKTYEPGWKTIKVSSHTNLDAALQAKEGAGEAYYEASQNVELKAGVNNISFSCGTAKNSKVSVDWSGTNGVSGLSMTNIVATQNGRAEYTYANSGTNAFFKAGENIECTINYTYNGANKTISKTITAPAAATEYKLMITANDNGSITTITISYDDTFEEGSTTSVTIDAATGAETSAATGAETA